MTEVTLVIGLRSRGKEDRDEFAPAVWRVCSHAC